MSRFRDFRVYSGSSNQPLAKKVASELDTELGKVDLEEFADGERFMQYKQTVRGVDVFIVQSLAPPVNDNLMELLLMIDSAMRASAARVTAVIPYLGYSRQDRKNKPRVPISAKLVANQIQVAGADRVLTMHMHSDQIQGFYDIPVDHLYSTPIVMNYLEEKFPSDEAVIVSPDVGAADRSRALARRLDFELAIIDKRRPEPNKSEVANIIGEVEGRNAILLDDMVDTAGTLTQASRAIEKAGANSIMAVATHPIFSEPSIERITNSPLEKVIVCNTIQPREDAINCDKVELLDTSGLMARAITCIHEERSIQKLFV